MEYFTTIELSFNLIYFPPLIVAVSNVSTKIIERREKVWKVSVEIHNNMMQLCTRCEYTFNLLLFCIIQYIIPRFMDNKIIGDFRLKLNVIFFLQICC